MKQCITLCLLLHAIISVGQKQIEHRQQAWFGYINQTRFTKKSGIWVDLHLRLTDQFVNQKSITIARAAYVYYLTDQTRLAAGYAYVSQYNASGLTVPEHRPWQQIQWFDRKNGFNLMQWLRVEERYRQKMVAGELLNDYNFNWRFRYNFVLTVPLKGKQIAPRTPFLYFNNEIFVNAGKSITNNYFDQNRFSAGVGYQFAPNLNVQIGYLNVFQQLAAANQFVNVNGIRLYVFHNLDFRHPD